MTRGPETRYSSGPVAKTPTALGNRAATLCVCASHKRELWVQLALLRTAPPNMRPGKSRRPYIHGHAETNTTPGHTGRLAPQQPQKGTFSHRTGLAMSRPGQVHSLVAAPTGHAPPLRQYVGVALALQVGAF